LDFLLETLIDLEEVDATEHAQAGARSGQHWGDIGAKLGSIAQAAARQHNRGKGRNERNRQTLEDSRVAERRVAVGKPKISGSREEAFAWQTKSVAKSGELHYESHYQRALEEHSSPARLRVRVTVKKPMVVSLSSLPYSWCLVDLAHGIIMPLPPHSASLLLVQVVYPTPITPQQQIDRYKRPGSGPPKRQTAMLDRETGCHTVPWRWRVTHPLPAGHDLGHWHEPMTTPKDKI
jgi:hypothetical protein